MQGEAAGAPHRLRAPARLGAVEVEDDEQGLEDGHQGVLFARRAHRLEEVEGGDQEPVGFPLRPFRGPSAEVVEQRVDLRRFGGPAAFADKGRGVKASVAVPHKEGVVVEHEGLGFFRGDGAIRGHRGEGEKEAVGAGRVREPGDRPACIGGRDALFQERVFEGGYEGEEADGAPARRYVHRVPLSLPWRWVRGVESTRAAGGRLKEVLRVRSRRARCRAGPIAGGGPRLWCVGRARRRRRRGLRTVRRGWCRGRGGSPPRRSRGP